MTKRPKRASARRSATHRPTRRRRALIRIKRVYEAPAADDGLRILVDRLWPRGMPTKTLKLDAWTRDLAPSQELRRWYHADMTQFAEFRRRYLAELAREGEAVAGLRRLVGKGTTTLLTASTAPDRSHAAVLAELLAARSWPG